MFMPFPIKTSIAELVQSSSTRSFEIVVEAHLLGHMRSLPRWPGRMVFPNSALDSLTPNHMKAELFSFVPIPSTTRLLFRIADVAFENEEFVNPAANKRKKDIYIVQKF